MMAATDSLPPPLSAKDTSSFAYPTMKNRIPVILSKIVDSLNRNKDKITKEFGGEPAREELKSIIGALSQLRYEVMTNKPAARIRDSLPDAEDWNRELEKLLDKGDTATWFNSAWLWMECYLYRRVTEATAMCKLLKEFDVFEDQKRAAFVNSFKPMSTLTMYLLEVQEKLKGSVSESQLKYYFTEFLQMCLWGNKCDLSISAGSDNHQVHDPLEQLLALKPNILVDNTDAIFEALQNAKNSKGQNVRVDIVLDNAGFELITDWCLADFLVSCGLASSIHFHAKAMPWFVSDVTERDFHWTLRQMSAMNHIAMSQLTQSWKSWLSDSTWVLDINDFCTLPNDFSEMNELCPSLYSELQKSDLVIFKGDLNYRKLVGDLKWDFTTDFCTSLRGFAPAPLCALRTLKCDTVVGLRPGQGEEVEATDSKWMITGDWAVLSYTPGV